MKAAVYREKAEEMRRFARQSPDAKAKAEYERLAAAWIELAETHEQRVRKGSAPTE